MKPRPAAAIAWRRRLTGKALVGSHDALSLDHQIAACGDVSSRYGRDARRANVAPALATPRIDSTAPIPVMSSAFHSISSPAVSLDAAVAMGVAVAAVLVVADRVGATVGDGAPVEAVAVEAAVLEAVLGAGAIVPLEGAGLVALHAPMTNMSAISKTLARAMSLIACPPCVDLP